MLLPVSSSFFIFWLIILSLYCLALLLTTLYFHFLFLLHILTMSSNNGSSLSIITRTSTKTSIFSIPQLLPVFVSILFLLFCPEIYLTPLSIRSSWHSRVTVHSNHMPIDRCFVHSRDAKLINIKDNGAMHLFVVVSLGFFLERCQICLSDITLSRAASVKLLFWVKIWNMQHCLRQLLMFCLLAPGRSSISILSWNRWIVNIWKINEERPGKTCNEHREI